MLETKEQKQIFIGSLILIIALGLVSLWRKPNLSFIDNSAINKPSQDFLSSKAYLDYIQTAAIDPSASKELFQTILTQDQIKQQVEEAFQVGQKITPPAIDDKKFNISPSLATANAISDYLTASVSKVYSFNADTSLLTQGLFSSEANTAAELEPKVKVLINGFYDIPVPKEAVTMHKALVSSYVAYDNLLNAAKSFDPNQALPDNPLWPEVYKDYSIVNNNTKALTNELNALASKYKISLVKVNYFADSKNGPKDKLGNIFVPKAQAFAGVGDTTFNFTLGDIPRIIMDAVKEGLRSSFLQFMGSMLNNLITKIEQNYVIANFLYYTDALVNGQYANDYLNKYVSDSLDREIIKKFIPQFNCGKNQNLKSVFQAKANQNLGFDPSSLSLKDPNYYQKMANVGDFLSSPSGWQLYYQDLAGQTQSAAQKAAEQELTSSGLKTPRNTLQSSISSSVNSIVSAESGGFHSLLQLGINNADSVISGVVATLTQTLVNKFVFQGATSIGGNIAVLKEQATCVSAAVLNPVLPLPANAYQPPASAPTAQAVMAQQCSALAKVSADCTSAVSGELSVCAQTPSQHTGQQTCASLAHSAYVNALLGQCSQLIRPTAECSQLQGLLQKIP